MMRRHEFINEAVAAEILELIRQSTDPAALADRLTDYHDYDIAQALEQLTPEERLGLFLPLGALRLSEILPYCDEPEDADRIPCRQGCGDSGQHGFGRGHGDPGGTAGGDPPPDCRTPE